MKKLLYAFIGIVIIASCQEDPKPKPSGFLALNFPEAKYTKAEGEDCPYSFEINKISTIKTPRNAGPCMVNIEYPSLDGTIYITYEKVDNNLDKLLEDAQNLPLKHTIKADEIYGDEYTDENHKTYGMLYTVTGNAASQSQFYLTDSTEHFITGSVYFKKAPYYDSIYPAAEYLKGDMKKLMESLQWKD